MFNAMLLSFVLFAETVVTHALGALALTFLLLGAVGGGWWGNANRARNATGGPVPPATTRDYVLVTISFALAIAAVFVGLYYMKR